MDTLVWKYLVLHPLTAILTFILLITLGFVLALLRVKSRVAPMRRVPYLLVVGAAMLLGSLSSFVWVLTPEAVHGGWLWALAATQMAVLLLVGMFLGWAAAARAKSYSGEAGKGWLALVPFVNLILHFKAPLGAPAERSAGRVVADVLGIILGLGLMVASKGLDRNVEAVIVAHAQSLAHDPAKVQAMLRMRLAAGELPAVLQETAAQITETRLNEMTVLKRATALGTTLQYHYAVAPGTDLPGPDAKPYLAKDLCAEANVVDILKAGATMMFVYSPDDGGPASELAITLADCAAT